MGYPLAAAIALAALLGGLALYFHSELEKVNTDFIGFRATTQAFAEQSVREAEAAEKRYERLKTDAETDRSRQQADFSAELKRVRSDARSRASVVSEPTREADGSMQPLKCYDWTELDSAQRESEREVESIIESCGKGLTDYDVAIRWGDSIWPACTREQEEGVVNHVPADN